MKKIARNIETATIRRFGFEHPLTIAVFKMTAALH